MKDQNVVLIKICVLMAVVALISVSEMVAGAGYGYTVPMLTAI